MKSVFLVVVAILGSLSQLYCPASGAAAYLTFQKSTHGDAQLQIDENAQMDTTVSPPPPLQMSPDQQAGGSSSSQQLPVGATMDTSSSDISQQKESSTFKSNKIPDQSSNVEPLPQVLPDSRSSLTQPDENMEMSSGRDGFGMNINEPDSSMMGFQDDDSMSQSGISQNKKLKSKSKKKTLVKQSEDGDDDSSSSSSFSSPDEFSLFYKHDEINLVKPDQINSSSTSKVFMINGVPVDTSDQAGSSPVIQKLNDFVVNLQSVLLTLNQTATTTSGGSNNQKVVESKSGKTSVEDGGMQVSSKKKTKVKKTEKKKSVSSEDQSMTTQPPYSSDGDESDESGDDDSGDEGDDE